MANHSSILAIKSHGQGSLVGCNPWGRKESGMTERLTLSPSFSTTRPGLTVLSVPQTCHPPALENVVPTLAQLWDSVNGTFSIQSLGILCTCCLQRLAGKSEKRVQPHVTTYATSATPASVILGTENPLACCLLGVLPVQVEVYAIFHFYSGSEVPKLLRLMSKMTPASVSPLLRQ